MIRNSPAKLFSPGNAIDENAVNMKNGKFVMGEEELTDKQRKYREFFSAALKKHGASSPTELTGEKRKQFFNYVKANWKG